MIPFLQTFVQEPYTAACRWDDGRVDGMRKQFPNTEQGTILEFVLICLPSNQELRQGFGGRFISEVNPGGKREEAERELSKEGRNSPQRWLVL